MQNDNNNLIEQIEACDHEILRLKVLVEQTVARRTTLIDAEVQRRVDAGEPL